MQLHICIFGLSRRQQGFKSPWGRQYFHRVSHFWLVLFCFKWLPELDNSSHSPVSSALGNCDRLICEEYG